MVEAFESDDSTVKAWGVGADLNLKTGYRFPRGERFTIAPFVGVGFTPYLFAPKTESVINQTQELISKGSTSILHAQAGIAILSRSPTLLLRLSLY